MHKQHDQFRGGSNSAPFDYMSGGTHFLRVKVDVISGTVAI